MLYITLREGDYFVIGGNVKVVFERASGRKAMFVGVDAPKDVQVLRGQMYENEIVKRAEAGDVEAQRLRQELLGDYNKRVRSHNSRRADEHQRMAEGRDHKPGDWRDHDNDSHSQFLSRAERDRRVLAGEMKPANTKDWGISQTDWSSS